MQVWPRSSIHILTPSWCSFFFWVSSFFTSFEHSELQDSFIVLHPYYKLDYIKMSWGGAKEQNIECLGGN